MLSGEITVSKLVCLPSDEGSTRKEKNFFTFRVDPITGLS